MQTVLYASRQAREEQYASGHVPSGIASARPAPPRDFDGIFKALVEALRRRGMNNILEQTETGREIARKNREEGREEGHVDLMRAALQAAYGDLADLDELARRLADRDHSGNIARIVAGATLDDLRS